MRAVLMGRNLGRFAIQDFAVGGKISDFKHQKVARRRRLADRSLWRRRRFFFTDFCRPGPTGFS